MTWKKLPSVTTGGKPFFYHGYSGAERIGSVVWNRYDGAYHCEFRGTFLSLASTVRTAQHRVESAYHDELGLCKLSDHTL